MDWVEIASKIGIPTAFCAALLYLIVRVGQWIAPRADKAIDAHLAFIDQLDKRDAQTSECLRLLTDETTRHRQMCSAHMQACELIKAGGLRVVDAGGGGLNHELQLR